VLTKAKSTSLKAACRTVSSNASPETMLTPGIQPSSIAEEDEAVLVRTEMVYLLSFARATEVI
jgi:hypothetical protein